MKALILAVFVFFFSGVAVSAQEALEIDTVSPTPVPEIVYTLPYPGILPDNPLYVLKATRDRIVSFFIADPIKKAEFDLLQADKRVQAGLFLLHKEDPDIPLAISTISKGQNYLHEALAGIAKAQLEEREAKKTSLSFGDLPDKLYNAARKHNQLLKKETTRFDGQDDHDFTLLVQRSEEYIQTANNVRGNK